jgi:phosphoglycerate kinase
MLSKKTIRNIDVSGKRVILHADFNITLVKDERGELVPVSEMRLKAFLPTIEYLLQQNAKIIFISYLGRPEGRVVEELRLAPIAKRLSELLGKPIPALSDCVGPKVNEFIEAMQPGQMVMLENTRFYPGEEADDDNFARQLAENGDLMVEDAFGHCHRKHASTTGIPRHLLTVAGFYLEKEVGVLDELMTSPQEPLVLILGGTKTYDKIKAIENLMDKTAFVLVGGAVANIFLRARGVEVGSSFMEEPYVDIAMGEKVDLINFAAELLSRGGEKIILPEDLVAADSLENPTTSKVVDLAINEKIPTSWAFLDIGPKTTSNFIKIIERTRTIFWDGPMGKSEDERFSSGTLAVTGAITRNPGTKIAAGGDTAGFVEKNNLIPGFTHVSVAGGATLEYLAGKKLPGIEALLNLDK